ncbi:hypothetical protein ACG7TL_005887 [Trametes sanguinea]
MPSKGTTAGRGAAAPENAGTASNAQNASLSAPRSYNMAATTPALFSVVPHSSHLTARAYTARRNTFVMSLDQNLFTLNVSQRADDRNVLDLVDPNGVTHYSKRRIPSNEYNIEVFDPLSESVLATVTAPSPTSKHKTIQLYNPDLIVELKYTGTIHFKWGFKWEEHDFEWRREECYILRKPDPAVLVAITKEPPGRLQTRSVQILDYNLNRFDIDDRKGLEIVILTALLTFQDLNETYHTPRSDTSPTTSPSESTANLAAAVSPTGLASRLGLSRQPSKLLSPPTPPAVPPRPAPRTGVDRVAELHAIRIAQGEGDANEVEVGEECEVQDYALYAERLLNIIVKYLLSLAHLGIAEDEELYQYVIYDSRQASPQRKGPRRINLDDPEPKSPKGKDQARYAPPTSLTVHLSKIDMPELQPKATPTAMRKASGSGAGSTSPTVSRGGVPEISDKDKRRAEKESKKADKESKKSAKESKKGGKEKEPARDPVVVQQPSGKLNKPSTSAPSLPDRSSRPLSTYWGNHVPPHQTHPHQPSPSPSQLNNPMIYAAPPPPPPPRSAITGTSPHHPPAFPMPAPSHYGTAANNAMPPPGISAGGYQPGYVGGNFGSGAEFGRRASYYHQQQQPASPSTPSSGKGPVTTLLELWSKH